MGKHTISIGIKKIGGDNPVFIIAEAGVNHNGKLSFAKRLIDVAAKSGADAVKFQTFNPDTLVTKTAEKASYQAKNESRNTETQHKMLKRLMLSRDYHVELKHYAEKKNLIFMSTPFSIDDAQFLRRLGVKALKVGSTDTNNIPYLSKIARFNLPIILSTGMSDLEEVKEGVNAVQKAGSRKLIILHCTTNYPTPFREANIRAIETLRKTCKVPVGFSDHTIGNEAAVSAVALGAVVIEKHFTLDRNLPGPDHKASLEPDELRDFVTSIRNTEMALGTGVKTPFRSEKNTANVARKSVVTTSFVKKGERFTEDNLGVKRPGTGLAPKHYKSVIGKKATRDIDTDKIITKHDYTA